MIYLLSFLDARGCLNKCRHEKFRISESISYETLMPKFGLVQTIPRLMAFDEKQYLCHWCGLRIVGLCCCLGYAKQIQSRQILPVSGEASPISPPSTSSTARAPRIIGGRPRLVTGSAPVFCVLNSETVTAQSTAHPLPSDKPSDVHRLSAVTRSRTAHVSALPVFPLRQIGHAAFRGSVY